MKINELLVEYREASLYHTTSLRDAVEIWASGGFHPGTSFTRMWTYAYGFAQGHGNQEIGIAIFSLDTEAIRRNLGKKAFYGYDYFYHNPPYDAGRYEPRNWTVDTDRAEERNKVEIPIPKYLKKLQIWMPIDQKPKPAIEQLSSEPYTYERITDNNLLQQLAQSIGLKAPDKKWYGLMGWQIADSIRQFYRNKYYDYVPKDSNKLINPKLISVWKQMQQHPKVEIINDKFDYIHKGVDIPPRLKYDQDHPAYGY